VLGSASRHLRFGFLSHLPAPSAVSHERSETSGVWHDESSSCIQPRDWPSDASDWAFHADVPLYATQCVGRSAWR